ncbi:citronellol/citronellal dehydrogenase [Nocardia tenerifensis]|uniref:Citronellol/citronellal dehydrogenase n=1 Tax=Nocardia tenerifensis TaxID=228006 RepID=A0A318K4H9_9NOCA|nr:NAD(P)-dependent oxidoreductase [Nocardia tenerifensis]PXX63113.1 citronellol/citronellal dehydrogenase [Nocardia tenerifensis]
MTESGSKPLAGRTLIMSGGSRGIGLEIAKRAAADGANITLIAKTDLPHPKLPGTIHTAAAELEAAGAQVLPFVGDVRVDDSVAEAVRQTVEKFGGIDIVVNNASAIDLSPTDALPMKKYDLMQDINARGSFLLSKLCIPHLRESAAANRNPHILTLSPPLNLDPKWAGTALGYTIAKYGMSLTTLGLAEELKRDGIGVNSLWPRTTIATAAVQNLLGGEQMIATSRTPDIYADAAYLVLNSPAETTSGNFFIDDEVLAAHGITDLEKYRVVPGDGELTTDLFLDNSPLHR